MQWAAVVTFDSTNWYQPVTVPLLADPYFDLQPGRENLKSFPKRAHLLSGLRGPLAVEGGTTAADRSLKSAIMLPGEANRGLFQIADQPLEAQQVDVLNVFADSSQEDLDGTLTSTALTGLNMAGELDFTELLDGKPMPFGEPVKYPGGITYGTIVFDPVTKMFLPTGSTTTIEVLNILLGEGNDRLTITSTMVPGADHKADGSLGSVAVHGGLTTVHGGGNSLVEVRGTFTVSGSTLTRDDGVSWASAGFAVGQQITVNGTPAGMITALNGATMTLSIALPAVQAGSVVAARDPKTLATRIGGDTHHDHRRRRTRLAARRLRRHVPGRRAGTPATRRAIASRDFGSKPFTNEIGNGTPNFLFPLANPYRFAGHDTIDATRRGRPGLDGRRHRVRRRRQRHDLRQPGGRLPRRRLGRRHSSPARRDRPDLRRLRASTSTHPPRSSRSRPSNVVRRRRTPTASLAGADALAGDGGRGRHLRRPRPRRPGRRGSGRRARTATSARPAREDPDDAARSRRSRPSSR